ncbi:MAG: SBBP repeat-containing protein, partial [candidate division Zixibacteria bacterium]|nr:SBBP repeat-containing protein [candidate division Zixibacteria bacterium]
MRRLVIRSILLVVLVQVTASAVQNSGTNISANSQQQLIIEKNLTSMPLAFTENRGQWDEQALFRANAGGATMWFTSTGAVYQFTRSIPGEEPQAGPVDPIHELSGRQTPSSAPDMDCEPEQYESMTIKASFVGANPNPQVVGLEEMEYKCNYFIGNDPNEWHTDVPNYTAVLYEQVYDGIDLKYYGNGKQMEYDFIVSPGADFSQIQIDYEGAESISVNISGELVVETEWGEVVEQKPVIYQMVNNTRIPVTGVYSLKDDNSFGFKMTGDFDSSLPLVIDPVLSYSTYLGGNGDDYGVSIAVDGSGSAYVTGHTNSTNFPTLNPIQATNQGAPYDVFVTKLSSSGNSLVYSTYLGGSSADWGESITIDGSGSAYVTGDTYSTDFPTLNPIQTTNHGYYDVFVTKLSSSGNSLVYSTYLGESDNDGGNSIAVDGSGSAYVTGQTFSTDFPTLNPYQTYQGDYDLFVTKLSSSGNSLVYST